MMWAATSIALVFLGWGVLIFNRLIADRNQVRAAWSDIDVQLLRRHDLVPPLVTTVKAYADYERATLTAVSELRNRIGSVSSLTDRASLELQLGTQIDRLLLLQERYPELKASEQFLQLQRDLVAIEDHLQYARRFYNGAVKQFNTRIEHFPDLLIARSCGFHSADFFEPTPSEPLS